MTFSPVRRDPALRAPFAGAHLLVVDDDDRLRAQLKRYIGSAGYRVTTAARAAGARRLLACLRFDLLVVDVSMPGESGLELTASLAGTLRTPILLLSALGEADHRIAGLERGADDYLGKPFEPRELLLRIRSVLRRAREAPAEPESTGSLQFGALVYDVERGELQRPDGTTEALTDAEAALMRALARHSGTALRRQALIEGLGGETEPGQDRAIDVRVSRLRRKLEPDPAHPRYLKTVRGRGYMLAPDPRQPGPPGGE